jgi:glycine cleavage system aminomethyltransferase T
MAAMGGAKVQSLDELMAQAGGAVKLLRASNLGPYVFPIIAPEFTNWRDEQRAWKQSCALLELSYHMTELHLRGPGALPLLARLAVNRLDPFPVRRAKQLVLAGHDGNMIGDAILFREEPEFFRIVGAPFASNWIQFNAEQEKSADVEISRDENFAVRSGVRDVFRIQVQGPNALALMRDVTQESLPDIKFFDVGEFRIARRTVRALRHGMVGEPGFEIYGRWEEQQVVREAIERAGERHGMRKIGALAYSTTAQESGWMPMPMPAIYSGARMAPYRQWLTNYCLETIASLGGSFVSTEISDYFVNPIELGYGPLMDFEREFIGRDALRGHAENPRRKKVTLVWKAEDVAATMRSSLFDDADVRSRFINLPNPMYGTFQHDAVQSGATVAGQSQWLAYSANVGTIISLAVVGTEYAVPGKEVSVLWGEPNSRRRTVDAHSVREIRARVAPAPYFEKVIKTGRR